MTLTCEHGRSATDGRYVGAWCAPFSRCACCGISFPYIDSAQFSVGVGCVSSRTWTPKDRCAECGGKYLDYAQIQDDHA